MIGAAKAILRRLLIGIAADSERRNSILMIIGSAAAGILLLLLAPIAVLSTMADIEPPSYSESTFDREAFLSQLMPEQQERLVSMEAEGQAIAEALAAIGLQEQTIKAQLIYMSYFDELHLTNVNVYANMFTHTDDRALIDNINSYYDLDIDYDFKVFDDPNEMFEAIREKNKTNNKSRVVAGYCWEWEKNTRRWPHRRSGICGGKGFRRLSRPYRKGRGI